MPGAKRYCRFRRIRRAGDTSAGYSAAILAPAAPAMPATRRLAPHSSVRVVAFPIGAWLSTWLRSLLVGITFELSRSVFFEGQAAAPHGSLCATCWPIPSAHWPPPAHFVPRPAASAPVPILRPLVLRRNSGAPWSHRTLWHRGPEILSRIASR